MGGLRGEASWGRIATGNDVPWLEYCMTLGVEMTSATADTRSLIARHPWWLLAAIVDSCQDAIIGKDLTSRITSWNPAAEKMFGYLAEEAIGRSVRMLIPPELQDEESEILRKVGAGERIERYETVRITKNGQRLELSLTISPIRDAEGQVIGASKIAHDISERRRMEQMLLQSEKLAAAGRLAASIAHEINNPLEAVMNLVFLARNSAPKGSESIRYLEMAESELERVSRIARTTLGYYRDRGVPTPTQLSELLDAVLMIQGPKLAARGIAIDRDYQTTRPIKVGKGEFMQVFSNLLSNSMDAMPNGGRIRVRVAEEKCDLGDCVRAEVEDTGSGIEEKNLAHVFDPFFTTKLESGTGIGLWVTRRIVDERGGRIGMTSRTQPGKSGTTVTMEIPY